MPDITWLQAAFLGLVEGLTEFIPVSSTGHLILFVDLLGFQGPPGRVFEVVIQFGAILAVCVLYFQRLWRLLLGLPRDEEARHFVLGILLAFLPAVVIGIVAHGFIKSVLFSPWVVAISFIVGGLAILAVEAWRPVPRYVAVEQFSLRMCLSIGFCQTLAMIPGVSRSGATIMGALMLGANRTAAAEFSFFLAIPTMLGAASYDLYKSRHALDAAGLELIAIGFVVAFVAALLVVRALLAWISRHGFGPFAWYRIIIGTLMLGLLSLR